MGAYGQSSRRPPARCRPRRTRHLRSVTAHPEAHNMIFRVWLDFGLPGAVALCVALIATVCNAHRARTTPHASPSMTLHANLAINCTVWITTAGLVQDSFTAVTSSHLLMLAVGLHIGHMAMLKHRSPRLGQGTLSETWLSVSGWKQASTNSRCSSRAVSPSKSTG